MTENLYPFSPDYSRSDLFSDYAKTLLNKHYMLEGEGDPQDALLRASVAFSGGDNDLAKRIYDYASKHWFMFASPVLSNAPKPNAPVKALPASCFGSEIADTRQSIVNNRVETSWMTFMGGGVGIHASKLRSAGPKSDGPIPFLHVLDAQMLSDRQSYVRRGSVAFYMDINNPDIEEFISSKDPIGGSPERKLLYSFPAVNVSDLFMEAVERDLPWDLVCPHSKEVKKTVKARDLWRRILHYRKRTGVPYLCFVDTANKGRPQAWKDKGLVINGSNLCSEIFLPTSEERSFVCVLSSVNLEKWDEWKDTRMVEDLITMLDNVVEVFIENCPPELAKCRDSAYNERSVGLGAMGFHSLLQQKFLPFGSLGASVLNETIFKTISERATAQTIELAKLRGGCPDDPSVRNMVRLALAPNGNNSIILDTSPSIEPWADNAFMRDTRIGQTLVKNKYLEKVLEAIGRNTPEVWKDIMEHQGSVAHLGFLSEETRDVFKTAFEIDQRWIITLAAERQKYIDQGQSLNLFFTADASKKYISDVHLAAWKKGLKSLYYFRSMAEGRSSEQSGKGERKALGGGTTTTAQLTPASEGCLSCTG